MNKKLSSLIISCLLLVTQISFAESKQEKKPRVLLIGDSLAEGAAGPLLSIAKKEGVHLSINCLHGTRIDYWSQRIESVVNGIRPDIVIVSLGTNDSGIKNPEPQRAHVKKIVSTSKKYKSKILWLLPPPLPEKFKSKDAIRKIILDELGEKEVYNSDELKAEKTKDKIHMTANGYKKWISSAWEKIVTDGLLKR